MSQAEADSNAYWQWRTRSNQIDDEQPADRSNARLAQLGPGRQFDICSSLGADNIYRSALIWTQFSLALCVRRLKQPVEIFALMVESAAGNRWWRHRVIVAVALAASMKLIQL